MVDYTLFNNEEEQPSYGLLKKSRAMIQSPGGVLSNTVQPGQGGMLPNAIDAYRSKAADLYQQGSELYNQEPDFTQFQNFAKKRGEQGEAAMLNALAAQYAGDSFAPVQEQYLKRAATARDPMKMGSGLITAEGEFLKDPEAAQNKKAEFLLQQAKAYENMAATAQTASERIAAQKAQEAIMNQMRLMGLNIQQQGLDLRRDLAANKPEDNSKIWRAEDTLRNDFDKMTKDLREEMNATSKITQIVGATPPGTRPDAITQQSLVILLNKFLDPGSVVREGEFDRVVKAQGLEGRAANLKNYILKGEPLNDTAIAQINSLAKLYSDAATSKVQKYANDYTAIAERRKLNPENVISDPRFRGGSAAPAGDAPPGVDPNVWRHMTPQERSLWR